MKTAEEIRDRAKSYLKYSFRYSEDGKQMMAERNEARYEALCWVLGIAGSDDDALWEEAQKEYEEAKKGEER